LRFRKTSLTHPLSFDYLGLSRFYSLTMGDPDVTHTDIAETKIDEIPVEETFIRLSKKEKKKLRKIKAKEREKEKKKQARSERIVDNFSNKDDDGISYFFENGLRKVQPYFFTYRTSCRGRWIGRTVLDVVSSEFRYDVDENYATRLRMGLISINGQPVPADHVLKNGDQLASRVHRHELPVTAASVNVVADTDNFVVVDKPSSIPVHPCGRFRHNSLTMIMDKTMGYKNLRTFYRLDRHTSGVYIFVKNFALTQRLSEEVRNRELQKTYVCRVMGEFPETREPLEVDAPLYCVSQKIGIIRVDERGKEAKTLFERLSFNGTSSVVKCMPKTGRTHQIRVHLQYLGFPIMNDRFYNCPPLWGPLNGKGGDYGGKTDEQLIQASTEIFTVNNYLQPEQFSEIMKKKMEDEEKGGDDEEDEERTVAKGDQGIEDGEEDGKPPCKRQKKDEQSQQQQQQQQQGRDGFNFACSIESEILPLSPKSIQDSSLDPDQSKSNFPFDQSDSSFDPSCKDCLKPCRDPEPSELVMFLHALRYQGLDFDFATPLPDWAQESWKDEDNWTIKSYKAV